MMPRKISVCLGYWKNDDATVVVVAADGYFRTGDAAVGNVSRGGFAGKRWFKWMDSRSLLQN
jgi:acyl-CoA synthetase (AMP-forming)/AMP-acid ligase II